MSTRLLYGTDWFTKGSWRSCPETEELLLRWEPASHETAQHFGSLGRTLGCWIFSSLSGKSLSNSSKKFAHHQAENKDPTPQAKEKKRHLHLISTDLQLQPWDQTIHPSLSPSHRRHAMQQLPQLPTLGRQRRQRRRLGAAPFGATAQQGLHGRLPSPGRWGWFWTFQPWLQGGTPWVHITNWVEWKCSNYPEVRKL